MMEMNETVKLAVELPKEVYEHVCDIWNKLATPEERIIIEAAIRKAAPIKDQRYPLVTHYSFDAEVPVWLFDTEDEAIAELRRQFEEEKRIELEENGRVEGKDVFFKISDDGTYASITHIIGGNEPDDVTEWTVGDLKNSKEAP